MSMQTIQDKINTRYGNIMLYGNVNKWESLKDLRYVMVNAHKWLMTYREKVKVYTMPKRYEKYYYSMLVVFTDYTAHVMKIFMKNNTAPSFDELVYRRDDIRERADYMLAVCH